MILDHLFTRTLFESQTDHITQFASNAHEEWRRNFDPTGTKPRIKKNSDGTEGDINVPFADLHPDWQKENLAAAHAAHRAVKHFGRDMEKAAEYVHNEWMKRNPKADYNAAQHVPYDDLPQDEKEKDRVHVRTMMQLMGHSPEQGVAVAGFPGAPDVEMPPMKPSGDPKRDKLKQEYIDLHREIKSLVDLQYTSTSDEEKIQAKARIKRLNDRADQIRAILEPRQPPNEWQKKTYGYDDNWNKVDQGVAEGLLGSDPNRGQKVPGWAKGGIIGKIGRKLDPAWSDIQMTVPRHLLSKQSSVPDKKSLATKDMPKAKATSITPTRAIPKRAGTNPSHPVTKNVVKTIADKSGVAEGSDRVDSLVTDALKIMRGPEMSDAVLALKRVLGNRAYNERRGFYSFYVDKIHHMYGQQGMAENNAVNVPQGWEAKTQADGSTRISKIGSIPSDVYKQNMADYKAKNWTLEKIADYEQRMASGQGYTDAERSANYQQQQKYFGKLANTGDLDEQGVAESNTLMKKLHQALLQEGRVKELADDLKTMNDAEFMKKYGKAKAAIRKDMKKVDEGNANSGRRGPNSPPDNTPVKLGRVQKVKTGIKHHADSSRYGGTVPDTDNDHLLSPAARHRLHKAVTPDQQDLDEGNMPQSVIKSKQKYADMSDQEFHAAHKNKSEDDLKSMAWRHGYGKGSNHYVNRHKKGGGQLNELSNVKLGLYKTAAGKDATAADKAGNFKRGNKRMSGITNATKKELDNDAAKAAADAAAKTKKIDESRQARQALMAKIVNHR